jgi:eukaryotic-like serine/threonine-protein kinase
MTPERWQQIRDVLEKALELTPGQRPAFLDRACLSDPSLRQEVEILLASNEDVRSSFLQSSSLRVTITPGTKLGDYEVKSLLGSGGMGEVYRARDSRLGRDVAIKVLPSFLSADSDRLRRFEQEARAAAALNHPNILAVHQMGTYEGAPYLVSELLEGETLREQIKRGRLPIRKSIDYGVQIARGLAAAHEKGIVHRDLKPENLFSTKDGRLKILDFGLAKLTQPQSSSGDNAITLTKGTEAGMVMGTVGYMAPEQVRGQTADHRADIFAFGAILYEILAGKRAFQKPTSAETMTAILNEDPPGISQVTTNIPPALQRVVHRCLEKNPEQRFQSASDLAFALDALSENAGSATIYPGKEEERTSFIRQHKLLSIAAGLVLVGLLAATGWYFTRGLRSRNATHAKIAHKQFTFTGDAYSPAISPDGLFVVYISRKYGEPQKLIVQASNGTKVELARGTFLDWPRWSPDGSEVLFPRSEPALDKADPTTKHSGTFVVSRLGGVARPLSEVGYACWFAPDGSRIVIAHQSGAAGFAGVRLVNKLSGEAKDVHLSEYTWLRDIDCSSRAGLILAVTQASDNKYQIRTIKPDGSDERKLVEESDEIYSARWSPNGDSIYYLHGKGSTKQLSKLSATRSGVEPVVLADGLQTGEYFTLSADGSRLAYSREDHNSNLWRVPLQNAEKKAKPEISRLTSGTSYYGAPSFSPNGRWIAFGLGPNPDETNIFKSPVAGGELVQLTFFEHAATANPAWSPDGQRIAFISDQNGTPKVWTISANGGTAQALENSNASGTNDELAWWPSSDIVYQQTGVQNYLRINDKTHKETPIIQADQSRGWVPLRPAFSPDGKKIAVTWNRHDQGLWIISLEPYSETFLLSRSVCPFGWSPDGKYVYAIRSGPGREIIRVQVAAPNEVTSVATLPGDVANYDGASVSPDGKQIIVSVGEEKSDVWLMENFDPSPR